MYQWVYGSSHQRLDAPTGQSHTSHSRALTVGHVKEGVVWRGSDARGLSKGSFVRVGVVAICFITRTTQTKGGPSSVLATVRGRDGRGRGEKDGPSSVLARWEGEEKGSSCVLATVGGRDGRGRGRRMVPAVYWGGGGRGKGGEKGASCELPGYSRGERWEGKGEKDGPSSVLVIVGGRWEGEGGREGASCVLPGYSRGERWEGRGREGWSQQCSGYSRGEMGGGGDGRGRGGGGGGGAAVLAIVGRGRGRRMVPAVYWL